MIERDERGDYIVTNDAARAHIYIDADDRTFRHAHYRVIGTPEQLIRLGVCRPSQANRTRVEPCGQPRSDGRVCIQRFAHKIIPRDTRFQEAIQRVLEGAPCVDYRFAVPVPRIPRRRRAKTDPSQGSTEADDGSAIRTLTALPLALLLTAMVDAVERTHGYRPTFDEIAGLRESSTPQEWKRMCKLALYCAKERQRRGDTGEPA